MQSSSSSMVRRNVLMAADSAVLREQHTSWAANQSARQEQVRSVLLRRLFTTPNSLSPGKKTSLCNYYVIIM